MYGEIKMNVELSDTLLEQVIAMAHLPYQFTIAEYQALVQNIAAELGDEEE